MSGIAGETGRNERYAASMESITLAADARVFNAKELRGELSALGHTFTLHTDEELIGRAYAEWGRRCLSSGSRHMRLRRVRYWALS